MSNQHAASKRRERTEAEKRELKMRLNGALSGLSAHIRQRSGGSEVLLQQYDGKGKLFEALILFSLRMELRKNGVDVQLHPKTAAKKTRFLLRGAPGRLNETQLPTDPSYFIIAMKKGRTFEVHGSVEWPDHHVGAILGHELDISIAPTKAISLLRKWTKVSSKLPRPMFAVEAKFQSRGPDKSLGRELTGLAYGVQGHRLLLVSSNAPDQSVIDQLAKVHTLGNGAATNTKSLTYFDADGQPDDRIFTAISDLLVEDLKAYSKVLKRFFS